MGTALSLSNAYHQKPHSSTSRQRWWIFWAFAEKVAPFQGLDWRKAVGAWAPLGKEGRATTRIANRRRRVATLRTAVRSQKRAGCKAWKLLDRDLGVNFISKRMHREDPTKSWKTGAGAVQSALPTIRTARYEDLPALWKTDPPDLGVILMPNFTKTAPEDPQQAETTFGFLIDTYLTISLRVRGHRLVKETFWCWFSVNSNASSSPTHW